MASRGVGVVVAALAIIVSVTAGGVAVADDTTSPSASPSASASATTATAALSGTITCTAPAALDATINCTVQANSFWRLSQGVTQGIPQPATVSSDATVAAPSGGWTPGSAQTIDLLMSQSDSGPWTPAASSTVTIGTPSITSCSAVLQGEVSYVVNGPRRARSSV